jgi:DNA-binding NarL/FixJ family response regulator
MRVALNSAAAEPASRVAAHTHEVQVTAVRSVRVGRIAGEVAVRPGNPGEICEGGGAAEKREVWPIEMNGRSHFPGPGGLSGPAFRARPSDHPDWGLFSVDMPAGDGPATPIEADPAEAAGLGGPSIENALSEALALIEGALNRHRDSGLERSVVDLSGSEEIAAITTGKLIAEAQQELVCVSTPESILGGPLRAAIEGLRAPSERAARIQMLFYARDREAHERLRGLVTPAEAREMRVTGTQLQEMLLVDRRVAMVVSQFGPSLRQTLVVRSPAILKALHGLFTNSWSAASPVTPAGRFSDPRLCETSRLILASLRDGHKDDVAARELGMSVRTYRRHVADIMRDINATSRFQAGVRAAELRLLPLNSPN